MGSLHSSLYNIILRLSRSDDLTGAQRTSNIKTQSPPLCLYVKIKTTGS